jgi:hypothetical protein
LVDETAEFSLGRASAGLVFHTATSLRPGLDPLLPLPPPSGENFQANWGTGVGEVCERQGYAVVGVTKGDGGTSDALSLVDRAPTGWTVCQWVRPAASLDPDDAGERRSGGFDRFPLWSQSRVPGRSVVVELDDELRPRVEAWSSDSQDLVVPADDADAPAAVPAGVFAHICTRLDASMLSILVNGTVVGETEVPDSFSLQATSAPFLVGRYTPTGSYDRCFIGEIASMTGHSVALSTSVLASLAARGPPHVAASAGPPSEPGEVDDSECGGAIDLRAACSAQCNRLLDSTLSSCVCLEGGVALADCSRVADDPAAGGAGGEASGAGSEGNIILILVLVLLCVLAVGVYSFFRARKAPYRPMTSSLGTSDTLDGTSSASGRRSKRRSRSNSGSSSNRGGNYGRIDMVEMGEGSSAYGVAPNLNTGGTGSTGVYQAADEVKRASHVSTSSTPVYDSVVDKPGSGGEGNYSEAPPPLYGTAPPLYGTAPGVAAASNYSSADDAKARQSSTAQSRLSVGAGTMDLE